MNILYNYNIALGGGGGGIQPVAWAGVYGEDGTAGAIVDGRDVADCGIVVL